MCRQVKTEFYKLSHTTALFMMLALFGCLLLAFSVCGEVQIMVSGSGMQEGWKIGETVGFFVRTYGDAGHPMAEEVIRTATSFTSFYWLAVLIFSVVFFSREYTDSTIKIAIAGGKSRAVFFLAKYVVVVVAGCVLYFLFMAIAFLEECIRARLAITLYVAGNLLKVSTLNCLIMLAFIGITLMLCVVFQHVAVVVGIMSLFTFSGPVIYMMVWDRMPSQPWMVQFYLKGNPMYYWMNICAYNWNGNIALSTVVYCFITTIITVGISVLILSRREIR